MSFKRSALIKELDIKIRDNSLELYNSVFNLCNYLKNSAIDKKSYIELIDSLILANNAIGEVLIGEFIADYILLFEDDIENEDVEKMFNFNYESLIKKDTMDKTKKMIISIIHNTKNIWYISDELGKNNIKYYVFCILKYCKIYRKYKNKKIKLV